MTKTAQSGSVQPGRMEVGRIEVITGPMFSGKSEELIRRLRRAQIARQKVQIFKASIDDRYDKDAIVSHSEMKIASTPAKTDRKSTRLNSSHVSQSRMPSSA